MKTNPDNLLKRIDRSQRDGLSKYSFCNLAMRVGEAEMELGAGERASHENSTCTRVKSFGVASRSTVSPVHEASRRKLPRASRRAARLGLRTQRSSACPE